MIEILVGLIVFELNSTRIAAHVERHVVLSVTWGALRTGRLTLRGGRSGLPFTLHAGEVAIVQFQDVCIGLDFGARVHELRELVGRSAVIAGVLNGGSTRLGGLFALQLFK